MRTISAQEITDTVARLCIEANTRLPQDVQAALDKARQEEPWPLAKNTLDLLWSNLERRQRKKPAHLSGHRHGLRVSWSWAPMCTSTAALKPPSTRECAGGYTDGYLRKSIVADPLRRGNTGDNTPAAITVHLVDGEGCRITVAPKGFGSENMSRIQMLKPADGVEGFKKFVLDTVKLAGSNPCPPIVLGIGVGGSFDKVAYLAKKAPLEPNPTPLYHTRSPPTRRASARRGFGGRTTCLGLAIEQMPTHVAGLPVAVNVSCHVTRRQARNLLSQVEGPKMEYRLTTPCTAEDLAPLKAGDTVLLSGVVYTARDQAPQADAGSTGKGRTAAL